MTIKQPVLEKVKKEVRTKNLLAVALNKSVFTITRWIDANEDNGPLTTLKALQVIEQETGLKQDEILEAEPVSN